MTEIFNILKLNSADINRIVAFIFYTTEFVC